MSLLDRLGEHIYANEVQPEVTNLLPPEERILLKLLTRVGYRRSGKEIFEAFWPILPMTPVELAIVREINGKPHIHLWYRKDDSYEGEHIPGGYKARGERIPDAIRRVLDKETGMELISYEFIRMFNTLPETGWVPDDEVNLLYLVRAKGEPSQGAFHPLDAVPPNTLEDHKYLADCVRGHLMRKQLMERGELRYDGMVIAPEWKWEVISYERPFQIDFRLTCDDLTQARSAASEVLAKAPNSAIVRHAHIFDDQGRQVL